MAIIEWAKVPFKNEKTIDEASNWKEKKGMRYDLKEILELAVKAPCLISLCEYTYTLRLPSILGRRRAKDKRVEMLTAAELGLAPEVCGLRGSATQVVSIDTKAPGLRKCS